MHKCLNLGIGLLCFAGNQRSPSRKLDVKKFRTKYSSLSSQRVVHNSWLYKTRSYPYNSWSTSAKILANYSTSVISVCSCDTHSACILCCLFLQARHSQKVTRLDCIYFLLHKKSWTEKLIELVCVQQHRKLRKYRIPVYSTVSNSWSLYAYCFWRIMHLVHA